MMPPELLGLLTQGQLLHAARARAAGALLLAIAFARIVRGGMGTRLHGQPIPSFHVETCHPRGPTEYTQTAQWARLQGPLVRQGPDCQGRSFNRAIHQTPLGEERESYSRRDLNPHTTRIPEPKPGASAIPPREHSKDNNKERGVSKNPLSLRVRSFRLPPRVA
jgi:hypothetical protein